ncbi:EAL domain-containing protein [Massilia sp. TS11]|uniref:EAL domain-containing protein n=1 Tax=Massilia sp. TS11 TaxID=2908003 RepID=UPI001EDA7594|nr:EAL domain-containing protein [Massilia sp. TS11]MCG2586401.1 EAL domain-containing protein [Massilia sp. TS11]
MSTSADLHAARILVVDDQAVNVQLFEYLLKNAGFTHVDSTTDPRQVAPRFAAQRYDLLILDLHMPGMDGFEVMGALRPLAGDDYPPVLVVTADPDQKLAALNAGARDFLGKPYDPVEALTRIRNILEVWLLHREAREHNLRLERTVAERTAILQRFRSAMDATADAIFLIDPLRAAVLDANEGACRLLGFERSAVLAQSPDCFGLATREQLEARAAGSAATGLVEQRLLRADGRAVPVETTWQRAEDGSAPLLIAVARDISERILAQQRLEHMAHYDSLTGLPNRSLFYQHLEQALAAAAGRDWVVGLLFINLDRFKIINDSLGAGRGDELLRQVAGRLVQRALLRDSVGRLGGDEFTILLTRVLSHADAVDAANQVREALRLPFDLGGQQVMLTASIGIAFAPHDATNAENLVKFADAAMDRAKREGRDAVRFFMAGMNQQLLERLDLEVALRLALEQHQFVLYYQPKVDLHTGRVAGVEALLRWRRPGVGIVAPADFVPVMEESGLIVRVGAWIIDEACRQGALWVQAGVGGVPIAVNVSSRQFMEGDLDGTVAAALARHRLDPHLLEIELTESAMMQNAEHTIAVLSRLRARGVRVAIDDFGTGYSSLAYLKRFPIDKLKIDIAFVRDITTNPDDAAIALAIVNMAHSLHLRVVAEGVESAAQYAYLRRHRCDEGQGFHMSEPVTAETLAGLVLRQRETSAPAAELEEVPRQTLLLVDNDLQVQQALARLFRRDNYAILTARDAHEAFEQLALHPVQVVMCEQQLPDASGTEFLARVKELYPKSVRIILSGHACLDAVLDAINRGAIYRFYTKPWDDAQLRELIRTAFEHYWQYSGAHAGKQEEGAAPPAPRRGGQGPAAFGAGTA